MALQLPQPFYPKQYFDHKDDTIRQEKEQSSQLPSSFFFSGNEMPYLFCHLFYVQLLNSLNIGTSLFNLNERHQYLISIPWLRYHILHMLIMTNNFHVGLLKL
jgi:hypothetical protein